MWDIGLALVESVEGDGKKLDQNEAVVSVIWPGFEDTGAPKRFVRLFFRRVKGHMGHLLYRGMKRAAGRVTG